MQLDKYPAIAQEAGNLEIPYFILTADLGDKGLTL